MKDKIRVEAILKKHINWFSEKNLTKPYSSETKVMAAVRELVKLAIDKAAENAIVSLYKSENDDRLDSAVIDEQSILDVKKLFEY